MYEYIRAWFTTSFCIDRSLPWGLTEGREGESDPGRARWFAYSPLHNPVAVIHHVSATGRGDASATMHPHGTSIRVVSTRAVLHVCGRRVEKGHIIYLRPILVCLLCPLRSPLTASKIPTEGIHDSTIAQANLHPWNPRRGQRQPLAIAYCKPFLPRFSPFRFIYPMFFPRGHEFHMTFVNQNVLVKV